MRTHIITDVALARQKSELRQFQFKLLGDLFVHEKVGNNVFKSDLAIVNRIDILINE